MQQPVCWKAPRRVHDWPAPCSWSTRRGRSLTCSMSWPSASGIGPRFPTNTCCPRPTGAPCPGLWHPTVCPGASSASSRVSSCRTYLTRLKMPSWPEIALSAALLWLALALVIPKRDWGTLRGRLAATAAGERRHLFGPPLPVSDGVSSTFRRLLLAELPRWLELGVPLWLATLAAEYQGFQQRRLAAAALAATPTGWMWA